jgi:hypothetical protein
MPDNRDLELVEQFALEEDLKREEVDDQYSYCSTPTPWAEMIETSRGLMCAHCQGEYEETRYGSDEH